VIPRPSGIASDVEYRVDSGRLPYQPWLADRQERTANDAIDDPTSGPPDNFRAYGLPFAEVRTRVLWCQ
jgi:hypothetical protein